MKILVDTQDKRNQHVLKLLQNAGKKAYVYLEYINKIEQGDIIIFSPAKKFIYEEVINFCPNVTIYCGNIPQDLLEILINKQIKIFNYLEDESFSIKNAKLTAEGVLALILTHTEKSITELKVLFLGGGRITKASAILLQKLGTYVAVASYNIKDYENAEYYSNKTYFQGSFIKDLGEYDVIVNTRPFNYITEQMINKISASTLFMETASVKSIGEDKKYNFTYLPAPALPQKYACLSAGKIIADKILKEINV